MAKADELLHQPVRQQLGFAPDEMNADWLYGLHALLDRYPHLGAAADLAQLAGPEAWGLYCYLSRLALG